MVRAEYMHMCVCTHAHMHVHVHVHYVCTCMHVCMLHCAYHDILVLCLNGHAFILKGIDPFRFRHAFECLHERLVTVHVVDHEDVDVPEHGSTHANNMHTQHEINMHM